MKTYSQFVTAVIASVTAECWIGEPSDATVRRHARKLAGPTFADSIERAVADAQLAIRLESFRSAVRRNQP